MPRNIAIIIVILVLAGAGYLLFKEKIGEVSIPGSVELPEVAETETLSGFTLPEGFAMSIFATNVADARVMVLDPKGTMLVSQPSEGKISALPNKNTDNKADSVETVISGLNVPHGMAFRCREVEHPEICEFYVAEKDALSIFDYNPDTYKASNKRKLLDLPGGSVGGHFTRTLLFMPSPSEDTLLISVGSSCNVCHEEDERRAAILSYNTLTKKSEIYAKGLRNAVFMTIDPVSGKVFAIEMGRDNLGDNLPPDEINIIEKGKNFGWPNCFGKNIHDDQFDKNVYIRNPCMEPFETPSFVDLQAHSAPLGLAFIPEEGYSEDLWYDLLVAYHGSWNRSTPTGYKIVRLKMDANKNGQWNYSGTEDFITGWLTSDGKKLGRPVDIMVFPGGTMYISDDEKGVIYRVARN